MQPAQPSTFELFFPFILMFAFVFFFMIRPKVKQQKEHDNFLKNLKRGDQVVTASGIIGTINDITEQFVYVEIASGVKIKMLKRQIASSLSSVMTQQSAANATAATESKKA